jgi:hypothetical protein
VSVKKAKAESEVTAKKPAKKPVKKAAKKRAPKAKAPVDMATVRENINNLVGKSARVIAIKVIKAAKDGQLASARYLFEAVGLYPATEETTPPPVKDTLAHTLLTRLGLPLDPVVCDEDSIPPAPASAAEGEGADATKPGVAEKDGRGKGEGDLKPMLVQNERIDGTTGV